jgi:hypothetical protein
LGLGAGFAAVAGFGGTAMMLLGAGGTGGTCEVRCTTGRGRARGIGIAPAPPGGAAANSGGGLLASPPELKLVHGTAALAG